MKYINYQLCSALHWYQANQHGCTLRSSHFEQESLVLYWWINQKKHADKTAQFLHLYANLHFWFSCSFKIWDEHILNYCLSLCFVFRGQPEGHADQPSVPPPRPWGHLLVRRAPWSQWDVWAQASEVQQAYQLCYMEFTNAQSPLMLEHSPVCVCTCVKQDWNLSLPLLVILIEVFWFGGFFVCVFNNYYSTLVERGGCIILHIIVIIFFYLP